MSQLTTSMARMFVPVYGPPGTDLTALAVDLALIPDDGSASEPASGDWHAAVWLSPDGIKPKEASLLIGAPNGQVYAAGDYVVFARVTATPEVPVIECGRWSIGR